MNAFKSFLVIGSLLSVASIEVPQAPTAPVWVPQAPPFGVVAALMGFPDLRSIQPVAGPAVIDVRVSDWSPLGFRPGRLLRLIKRGDEITATLTLWWFGNITGSQLPPAATARRCTAGVEGGTVCAQPVKLEHREWAPLLRRLLDSPPCPVQRPTDEYELRIQIFERQYRELDVCNPVAAQVGALFIELERAAFTPRR
jgi:hypothetical protein